MTDTSKSSAQLEREVELQRNRVEARLSEIKERLSPGQLLDEALSYTKNGGAHFASNLGSQISANPMPAALVGIGLAWLISSNTNGSAHSQPRPDDGFDYPYASIGTGGLKRVSHSAGDDGQWWSEFETSSGQRYKARADELGARAGHFTDEAGRIFSGFIDDAGHRVHDFRDEAGNVLDDARGWANHNWRDLRRAIGAGVDAAGSAARSAASQMTSGSRHLGGSVQQQGDMLSRQIASLFDQQPLVAGALAFAAGAAVGAALPHTAQEDKLVGEAADNVRREAGKAAAEAYQGGKKQAAQIYDEVSDKAGEIYGDAKDRLDALGSVESPFKH
ncbi:MAG: DUF3618 domain-containing protein [Devosia sp.]